MQTITAYHGTSAEFEQFGASNARGVYGTKSAAYQYGGETVKALTAISGVWLTENSAIADSYAEGPTGRVLDVEINAERVAEVDWTDDESVAEALTADPQVIMMLDRDEILVLDLTTLTITGGAKNCGCSLDEECGCWEATE